MNAQNNNISNQDERSNGDAAEKIPLIARVGMLVFGLIWTSGIVTMLSFVVWGLNQEIRKAVVYKAVAAVVTAYAPPETKTDEFGDDESTEGIIEYRYVVAGKARDAKHHQGGQFANEYSKKLYRAFETGEQIEAWYDPDDPESSTLEPVAEPQLLGFLIFMLPFIAIGLLTILTALTGKGPQINFSRRRGSGGRGMSVNMQGSGPYFGVFMVLCPVSAFAFIGSSMLVNWKTGWVIGLGWMLVGIPLTTFALGRIFSARKKAKARRPVETSPPEPVETFGLEDSIAETPAARLPSDRKKLIGAAAFTLFWCGITGVFAGFVAHAIYKSYDARKRFVSTHGKVLASKVKTHPGDSDSGPTYEPLIKYSYVVDGREYTSMRYAYGTFSTDNRSNASEIVKDHPPGRKITVWYDPRKPTEAAISIETPSMYYFLLLFLQPFILVGLGGIVYTVTVPYRFRRVRDFLAGEMRFPWAIPCWGTLRQGIQRIVLYPSRSPFFAFAMGYGVTCFLSIFVVGIFLGGFDNPDPTVIARTFAVAAGAGALAMLFSLFRHKARFEIDENLASLHVKSSKREFRVSFAEIDRWFLRTVTRATSTIEDSDGEESMRAPLLAVMTTDGTERPIHVFGSSDERGRIAEKVAREFAKFTGKPFSGMKSGEGPPAPEPSISGALSFMRARAKAARQYSDLN